jgi:hypothetical protein
MSTTNSTKTSTAVHQMTNSPPEQQVHHHRRNRYGRQQFLFSIRFFQMLVTTTFVLLLRVPTITSFMTPTTTRTSTTRTQSSSILSGNRLRQITVPTRSTTTSTTFLVAASKDPIIFSSPAVPEYPEEGKGGLQNTNNNDQIVDIGIDIVLDITKTNTTTPPPPPVAQADTTTTIINDRNGRPIEVGNVVRIVKVLKAYHVPAKARGSYDVQTKQFVPIDATTASRIDQNLVLPIGFRGIVSKVYRDSGEDGLDISANFPIKVQFTPGQNLDNTNNDDDDDDGYDPPIAFSMHLDPMEIEICS